MVALAVALVIDAMEDDTVLLERLDDTDAAVKLVLDVSVVATADTLVVGPVDDTLTVRVASVAELLAAVVCVVLDDRLADDVAVLAVVPALDDRLEDNAVELKEVPMLESSELVVVELETSLEPVELGNLVVGPAVVAAER